MVKSKMAVLQMLSRQTHNITHSLTATSTVTIGHLENDYEISRPTEEWTYSTAFQMVYQYC